MADSLGMPYLGAMPLDPEIAALCDRGDIENYPGEMFEPMVQRIMELAPEAAEPKMAQKSR